jgi:hypothetical protein
MTCKYFLFKDAWPSNISVAELLHKKVSKGAYNGEYNGLSILVIFTSIFTL